MLDHPQESLDPQDWEAMRALAHRMTDDVIDYLRSAGERPVWQPIPLRGSGDHCQ